MQSFSLLYYVTAVLLASRARVDPLLRGGATRCSVITVNYKLGPYKLYLCLEIFVAMT